MKFCNFYFPRQTHFPNIYYLNNWNTSEVYFCMYVLLISSNPFSLCNLHNIFSFFLKLSLGISSCKNSKSVSCSVVSNSLQPHGLCPTRLLCPWNFPGKNDWSESFPSPEDVADSGIKPESPALQAITLLSEPPGKPPWNSTWYQTVLFLCENELHRRKHNTKTEVVIRKRMQLHLWRERGLNLGSCSDFLMLRFSQVLSWTALYFIFELQNSLMAV